MEKMAEHDSGTSEAAPGAPGDAAVAPVPLPASAEYVAPLPLTDDDLPAEAAPAAAGKDAAVPAAEEADAAEATSAKERHAPGRSIMNRKARGRRGRKEAARRPSGPRTMMYPEEAAHWFVGDLLEVSGFVRPHMRFRSGYAHYRPVLTKPDPWYFAGLVALEASKIIDLFPAEKADVIMREVLNHADSVAKEHKVRVSQLVLGIIGRLGMGALLLHARVPDILIAKVMRLLLGSPKAAVRLIPTREAHEQVTSALRLGHPVWWKMFLRRYDIRLKGEPVPQPKLIPIPAPAEAAE